MSAGQPTTLREMAAQVARWTLGENLQPQQVNDAINDAVESLWNSLVLAVLSIFMQGPVSVQIAGGAERAQLVSIPDPTVLPTAANVTGGTLPAITYQVAYSYVTSSGSETNISPVLAFARLLNNLASISIPVTDIADAIGWNLYIGTDTLNLCKQNAVPIPIQASPPATPILQQTYMEPLTGFVVSPNGPLPPTENTTADNLSYIRHLEFQIPTNGGYMAYNQGDIDSIMMRRFAGSIATSSPYQSYAWDLINQRQLEIRPAAGATFTPRYFFVAKPRRMAFPNSPLPFPTIPSTEFIKCHALGELFLSLHEYEAGDRWDAKSEKRRIEAVRAVSQMNYNLNDRVTPYLSGGGLGGR